MELRNVKYITKSHFFFIGFIITEKKKNPIPQNRIRCFFAFFFNIFKHIHNRDLHFDYYLNQLEFNDTFTNYYYIQHIFYFIARFCIAFGNPIVPLLCIQFPKINTKKNNNKYNIEYIDYTIAE